MISAPVRVFVYESDARAGSAWGDMTLMTVSQTAGVIPRHTITSDPPRAADLSKYKVCREGDLVLNRFNAYRGALGVAPATGIVSPDYCVLRVRENADPRYLDYWLRAEPTVNAMLQSMGGIGASDPESSGFSRVNIKSLMRERILEGNVHGQTLIADFLDRETTKIDAVIEKQRALIDGLRMRKDSAVRDAFSAPKADTDARVIPHLGAVPSSWAVRPLWSLYRREKRTGYTDEPMVSVFREHGVVYKDDHANLNVTAEDRSIYQLVEPGWLVVNRMKAWQGSVGVSALRGISSGHYLCFRPLVDLHHPFMNWLFRSPQYRDWFAAYSRGVRPGQAEIDNEHLKSAPVILPPLNEQQRIADHLDRQTARIDALIARSERLIELSQERRSALITTTVTGQINIPFDTATLEGAA